MAHIVPKPELQERQSPQGLSYFPITPFIVPTTCPTLATFRPGGAFSTGGHAAKAKLAVRFITENSPAIENLPLLTGFTHTA